MRYTWVFAVAGAVLASSPVRSDDVSIIAPPEIKSALTEIILQYENVWSRNVTINYMAARKIERTLATVGKKPDLIITFKDSMLRLVDDGHVDSRMTKAIARVPLTAISADPRYLTQFRTGADKSDTPQVKLGVTGASGAMDIFSTARSWFGSEAISNAMEFESEGDLISAVSMGKIAVALLPAWEPTKLPLGLYAEELYPIRSEGVLAAAIVGPVRAETEGLYLSLSDHLTDHALRRRGMAPHQ